MEEMSKKTKRLEKENAQLTRKTELMNRNILEMAEERTRKEKELNDYKKKYTKIEGICRALQSDRTDLQNKLRGVEGDDLEEEEAGEGDDEEDYSGSEDGEHEGSEDFEGVEEDDDMTEDEAQVLERRGQGQQQQRQHNHAKFTSHGWRKIANTTQTAVSPSTNPIHTQKGVAVSNAASWWYFCGKEAWNEWTNFLFAILKITWLTYHVTYVFVKVDHRKFFARLAAWPPEVFFPNSLYVHRYTAALVLTSDLFLIHQ